MVVSPNARQYREQAIVWQSRNFAQPSVTAAPPMGSRRNDGRDGGARGQT